MMKYVLLVYRDHERWEAMPAGERASFEQACQASQQGLIQSLHLIEVKDLQCDTTLTVRIINGKEPLIDGFADSRQENLVQLLFIQARDLNAALQIASQMPQARAGPIEVRPLVE
jgi:hypothetical protein